jgi:hypothetical protein
VSQTIIAGFRINRSESFTNERGNVFDPVPDGLLPTLRTLLEAVKSYADTPDCSGFLPQIGAGLSFREILARGIRISYWGGGAEPMLFDGYVDKVGGQEICLTSALLGPGVKQLPAAAAAVIHELCHCAGIQNLFEKDGAPSGLAHERAYQAAYVCTGVIHPIFGDDGGAAVGRALSGVPEFSQVMRFGTCGTCRKQIAG